MRVFNVVGKCLEAIYQDLEAKAIFDADTTIALIDKLEKIWAGQQPDKTVQRIQMVNKELSLPGKSFDDLLACARKLSREQIQHLPAFIKIFELRASLNRYQSMYGITFDMARPRC